MDHEPDVDALSKHDRLWAPAELLLACAIVVGANVFDVVPISETPWLVLLGWLSLRRRGLSCERSACDDPTIGG